MVGIPPIASGAVAINTEVDTAATGLTSAEASRRLERDGPNTLPVPARPPPWRQFLGQMVHFFAVMLWVASAMAFLGGLPQLGVAIAVVVVVNGSFAFVQEYRAENAAAKLQDLLPRRATVVRDGVHVDVAATELVVGDLVLLDAGDHVSADLQATTVHALSLDTSTLTGESVPAAIDERDAVAAGTFVVEGEGAAVVVATGSDTRLAGIARLTRAGRRPVTPLALELRRVVRILAVIACAVGAAFFGVSLLLGTPVNQGFVFAIGVTVALVPEALLPTVTLALAHGAQRMVGRDALVRHLESVETLGSVTFICTDKTGTLTRNEMEAVAAWTPHGEVRISGEGYSPTASVEADSPDAAEALKAAALAGARCSSGHAVLRDDAWTAQGDPMEAALDVLARRLGADVAANRMSEPENRRFPFDPRRRRMSIATTDRVIVKGAPDSLMPLCRDSASAVEALQTMTARGLRVLAVASRPLCGPAPADVEEAERSLDLLALVGLEDPPRDDVADSIRSCRRAGMKVAMVTGDHPATAEAIAREVGLYVEAAPVVTGGELPDDPDDLAALIDADGIVISRVSPEDKLRIAQALHRRHHVVAMTGDGVNDGPALQEADIGVAMGRSGTDVAREAADLVLLDDHFATIVDAVALGRATFQNVRRFLTYHLTDNVAELAPFVIWALSAGNIPLAIGVLQVLALDIGTDTFPAVALGAEPPPETVLERPPVAGHLLDRRVAWRAFGVLGPAEAVMEMTAFLAVLVLAGWRPGSEVDPGLLAAASGGAFTAVVLAQMANAFACRSLTRPVWRVRLLANRLLLWAVAAELALCGVFLFVPPVARVLGQGPPTALGWSLALAAVPVLLLVDALDKRRRRRARQAPSSSAAHR